MRTRSRPAWLQILATLILTGFASGIGAGLSDAVSSNPSSIIGVWAGLLAAPVALIVVVGLWRSGKTAAWWFLAVTVAIYVGAGLLAGAFRGPSWSGVIPIMVLSPLVYPVAGLVWGALLYQAASQGYLPFLGGRAEID
jgi:hypothetical protein